MVEAIAVEKVDKSEQRIRKMFGEISPRYDFLNHLLSAGVDYYMRWQTVRMAPPRGTAPILDVCTGTGDLAISYWKAGREQVPVIGADFTREMLVIADQKSVRQRAASDKQPGKPPFVFLEADTQNLPFADDQFQIVSVAFGLRNVTDTSRGLKEMIRVCQPGGRVVVLEFSLPSNAMLRAVYSWYFRNILPKIGQLFCRNKQQAYDYLPASVSQFPYGQALADLMQSCGLRSVTHTPLSLGVATLYIGEK